MKNKKRNLIIASSILIGSVSIGSTAYAMVQNNQYQEVLENATTQIAAEQETLDVLFERLEGYELKNGYLSEELSLENLASIEKALNKVKDSYIDYNIEKDDLEDEIKVIKLDKKDIQEKLDSQTGKFQVQQKVNDLFDEEVLIGSEVTEQAVAQNITKEFVEELRNEEIAKIEEDTKWKDTLLASTDQAILQLAQIELADKEVAAVFKDDEVVSGVSRDAYNKAKTEVDKIENEDIKSELSVKLLEVLKFVEAGELKAKEEAEEKARLEAEAIAQAESEAQAQAAEQSNNTSSAKSEVASNSGSSNTGATNSSTSSSTSSGTSNSSNGSSTSTSSANSESSFSNSSSSNSSSASKSTSQSSGSGSSNSSGSKSGNSNSGGTIEKTGEGDIKNHGGDGKSGATYEEWTFDGDYWDSIVGNK